MKSESDEKSARAAYVLSPAMLALGIRSIARPKAVGLVYFATADGSDSIKIGFSTSLKRRLRQLECAGGRSIRLLVAVRGTRDDESVTHQQFKHARLDGEWFRPVPDLVLYIERLRAKEAT